MHTLQEAQQDPGGVPGSFCDALGRRVKAAEGGTTTITLFSGNDIVYEVKSPASAPAVTTRYLALNGKYLAKTVQEGASQPQTSFYHTDMVGSVRAITDVSGQVVARFEYEPFGVATLESGTGETHKFTGKPQTVTPGLYYFGARYYDSESGRFTARDPASVGVNWYEYGVSNPLRMIDPDGRDAKDVARSFVASYQLNPLEGTGYRINTKPHGATIFEVNDMSVGGTYGVPLFRVDIGERKRPDVKPHLNSITGRIIKNHTPAPQIVVEAAKLADKYSLYAGSLRKGLLGAQIASDVYQLHGAARADGGFGGNFVTTAGEILGSWVGAIGGATYGAAMGAGRGTRLDPGLGTVLGAYSGAYMGAAIGGTVGGAIGRWLTSEVASLFGR